MGIEFKYPYLLFILVPAGFLVLLFFRQAQAFTLREKVVISILRILIFTLIIFSLAWPQLSIHTNERNVVYIADTSASMNGTENEIVTWIEKSLQTKKGTDGFAILSMGKTVGVEQTFTNEQTMIQKFSDDVNPYETNFEEALEFVPSVLPSGANGRVILFSDGNETVGNIRHAAKSLKEQGFVLDYVPINGSQGADMAVTEFTAPQELYQGDEVSLQLELSSNYSEQADVRITLNDKELLQQTIRVNEGMNQYSFSYKAQEPGMNILKAEIVAKGDTFAENNSLYAVSNVKGTPRVLVVQDTLEGNDWDVLKDVAVDQLTPELLPAALSSYLKYGTIIFDNISATDVGEKKLKLIERAVKDFGVGFIMAGGENSYGLGGYFKTPIEELLPVEMEVKGKQELPSLGLVIVLDRSGSMDGEKLSLAKEAAARSVELLRDKDTLGFIAFDDRPWEVIETAPIKNKDELIEQIRSISVGGGTEIYPALKMAYDQLTPLKLQRKHIILLTDGQSATNQDYMSMIEEGKEANITLSTVALGQDADRQLLERLAEHGTGRFYDVVDDSAIPSILSRETAMTTRTYIVDHPFYPKIHSDPNWNPIFENGVPKMNAYIAVTPKQTAKVILNSEEDDPVLAEWQYGLGTTIAFTSDVRGKWVGEWKKWEKWPLFLNHLVTRTLPSYSSETLNVHVDTKNGEAAVHLSAPNSNWYPVETTVVSQTGEEKDVSLKTIAPGKHQLVMDQEPGMYFLSVKQLTDTGEEKVFKTGFTIPYTEELLMRDNNHSLLAEAAKITGGTELKNEKAAFSPLPVKAVKTQFIGQWLILLALFLFIIEIAVRRFGLSVIASLRPKTKTKLAKTKNKPSQISRIQKPKINKGNYRVQKQKLVSSKEEPAKINETNRQEQMKRLLEAKNRRNK